MPAARMPLAGASSGWGVSCRWGANCGCSYGSGCQLRMPAEGDGSCVGCQLFYLFCLLQSSYQVAHFSTGQSCRCQLPVGCRHTTPCTPLHDKHRITPRHTNRCFPVALVQVVAAVCGVSAFLVCLFLVSFACFFGPHFSTDQSCR
jgi:hypothetical protein